MVVLAIPDLILFLICLSNFPQFQVYLVLQQTFIKHLLYATHLIIAKGFSHQELVSPSAGRFTMVRLNAKRQAGARASDTLCESNYNVLF